jgi:hypothetical protein
MERDAFAIGTVTQDKSQSWGTRGRIQRVECFRIGALLPGDGVKHFVRAERQSRDRQTAHRSHIGAYTSHWIYRHQSPAARGPSGRLNDGKERAVTRTRSHRQRVEYRKARERHLDRVRDVAVREVDLVDLVVGWGPKPVGNTVNGFVPLKVLRGVRKRLQVSVLRGWLHHPGEVGRECVKLSGTCRAATRCSSTGVFLCCQTIAQLAAVSLCQGKLDQAHGKQQQHVKGAANKMRLDTGVNLFFHGGLFLGVSSSNLQSYVCNWEMAFSKRPGRCQALSR